MPGSRQSRYCKDLLRRTMVLLLAGILLPFVLMPDATGQGQRARPAGARRVETYQSATIDPSGMVITTSDQRTIVVRKEGEQTSFAAPIVSSAGTAVGAQAEFRNCCTSYDIPLQLVIYANGRVHRFTGIGLPIFRWHFADSGSRIAFGQEEVHFACRIHYELRDIKTERVIESVDIPEPCGQIPDPATVRIPKWVAELIADRK